MSILASGSLKLKIILLHMYFVEVCIYHTSSINWYLVIRLLNSYN